MCLVAFLLFQTKPRLSNKIALVNFRLKLMQNAEEQYKLDGQTLDVEKIVVQSYILRMVSCQVGFIIVYHKNKHISL